MRHRSIGRRRLTSGRGPNIRPRRSTGCCPLTRKPCSTWVLAPASSLARSTARGLEVIAVDPRPKMLDQLRDAVPEATVSRGHGRGHPARRMRASTRSSSAQAWHWVDQDRALPSVARVLRPGGTLGLVWNIRDERVPWVARLTEVMHQAEGEVFVESGTIRARAVRRDRDGRVRVVDRVHSRRSCSISCNSRSYVITAVARGARTNPRRRRRPARHRSGCRRPADLDHAIRHALLPDAASGRWAGFPGRLTGSTSRIWGGRARSPVCSNRSKKTLDFFRIPRKIR